MISSPNLLFLFCFFYKDYSSAANTAGPEEVRCADHEDTRLGYITPNYPTSVHDPPTHISSSYTTQRPSHPTGGNVYGIPAAPVRSYGTKQ